MSEKKERLKRGKEVYLLDLNQIKVEGFNPRFDYKDLKGLSSQIEENGLLRPLIVYKEKAREETYYILDGHRRFKAMKLAKERGWDSSKIPVFIERKPDDVTKHLATILYNEGEKLNLLEEAVVYQRLTEVHEMNASQIARKVSKSVTHILSCLNLLNSKPELIEKIKSGVVSPTMVVEKLKDISEEELNEQIEKAQAKGVKKVTAKHLKLSTEAKVKQAVDKKLAEKLLEDGAHPRIVDYVVQLDLYVKGQIDYDTLLSNSYSLTENSEV